MRLFFDLLSMILVVLFIMLLVFLFHGTPDPWDSLRDSITKTSIC
jgi:hypothetical protein